MDFLGTGLIDFWSYDAGYCSAAKIWTAVEDSEG